METSASAPGRLERIFAFMVVGVVGVSILCFIAVLIGTWTGQAQAQMQGEGIWRLVIMFPYFGLPVGMALIIALLITSSVRRSRAAKSQD